MKKLLLSACMLVIFFSCKKSSDTRPTSSYGQGVTGMNFPYNKAVTFYFLRSGVKDSDFVIFRANGSVTEVSNRFDSGSYTYPDSITYVVNTSYDVNILFDNIAGVNLFTFYPIYQAPISGKQFLLHDYLNNEVVSVFSNAGLTTPNLQVTPTLPADSTAVVNGYVIH